MIEAIHLKKRYGDRVVLKDLSFLVPDGQIAALLGPNGAGKSTLLGILSGYLAPDGGHKTLSSGIAGYLPENPPLYDDMTVREFLLFSAGWRDIPSNRAADEVERVMALFALKEVSGRRIGVLSRGYRQRTGLAQAELGKPEVILLDEPTTGLDPVQIRETREWIRSLAGRSSLVVSTHILEEAAEISDTVLVLHGGKIHQCRSDLAVIRREYFALYDTAESEAKG